MLKVSEGLDSNFDDDKKSATTYIKHNLGSLSIEEVREIPQHGNPSELKQILSLLKTKDYIQSSNIIYRNNLNSFLSIFMGRGEFDTSEDFPAIIDVKIKRKLSPDEANKLKAQLSTISPGLEIQKTRFWQEDLILAAGTIRLILAFLAFIAFVVMILITFFTTHIHLIANRKTIEILNLVGAPASYVARQFGGNILNGWQNVGLPCHC